MEYTQRPAPSARWALHGSSCLVLSCRSATSTSRRCGSACQLDSRTGLAARTVRGCPPRSVPRRAARDRPPIQLCACRRRRRAGRGGVQRLDGRQGSVLVAAAWPRRRKARPARRRRLQAQSTRALGPLSPAIGMDRCRSGCSCESLQSRRRRTSATSAAWRWSAARGSGARSATSFCA